MVGSANLKTGFAKRICLWALCCAEALRTLPQTGLLLPQMLPAEIGGKQFTA